MTIDTVPTSTCPNVFDAVPAPQACLPIWPVLNARSGRGVLDGALAVLDAMADADGGIGLTALSRATGLAKTSTYRLAEQLVTLGAAQRLGRRYYIGVRMGRIGERWQPDPVVRQAARTPVHNLAVQSGATASLRILHEDRLRVICATAPHGYAYLPNPADRQSTARTATGRVLYAARSASAAAPPDCWTTREWRQLRASIREPHTTVLDHQDVVAGVCCVSAPVWSPDGTCAGAVTAVVPAEKIPPNLPELVSFAARRIGGALQALMRR
jgi:DNA-binding IclR family transcriptional regulator